MLTDIDKKLLKIAYDEAKSGFDSGGCPIGSVLARGGQELSRGHNQRVQQGDPIGPALFAVGLRKLTKKIEER